MITKNTESANIFTRDVYYLSGFDPRGASFYHRLYQDECGKHAVQTQVNIQISKRYKHDRTTQRWTITNDTTAKINYHFLNWDDITREHWQTNLSKLILESITSYYKYIRCGAFSNIKSHFRGPYLSAIYPFLYLVLLLVLSASGGILVCLFTAFLGSFCLLLGIISFVGALALGLKLGNKLGIFWLLRTYIFVFKIGLGNSALMHSRLQAFIDTIAKNAQTHANEILVIGHSVGSIIAIHLLALLREQHPEIAKKIKLVTLGQCIPLLSSVPEALLFKSHLASLNNQNDVLWLDYVAIADSLAFYSSATITDVAPQTRIVRFFEQFPPKSYIKIKFNKLRLHFQYLMATPLQGTYNYFTLTAGNKPLQ